VKDVPAVEVGRVCVKKFGRDAGGKCVIVDVIDKNFVLVTGPKDVTGVRRRKVNVSHLDLTEEKIEISKEASDEEVRNALQRAVQTDAAKGNPRE
jgi:large subunit ribosomal protein L14e